MNKKKFLYLSSFTLASFLLACSNSEDQTTEENQGEPTNEVTSEQVEDGRTNTNNEENQGETTKPLEGQAGDDEAYPYFYEISYPDQVIDTYDQRHQEMVDLIDESNASFQDPLVIQDPYQNAPLTAMVYFETEEPTRISFEVQGVDEASTLRHEFEELSTEHTLPLYGLYADTRNQVSLTARNENGDEEVQELEITTQALPEDFFTIDQQIESKPSQMAEGLTFLVPSAGELTAVDANGDVRWYMSQPVGNTVIFPDEVDDFIATVYNDETEEYDRMLEYNYLGRPSRGIQIHYEETPSYSLFHHDLVILDNGNWFIPVHDGSQEYVEDEMVEADPDTGELVNRFNFREMVPDEFYEEYDYSNTAEGDWLHQNTISHTSDPGKFLVSSRNQDAVFKFDYTDLSFEWILADPQGWPEELEEYLLEPVDSDLKFPGGPHALYELPDQDGNPDTVDILMLDNNVIIERGDEDLNREFSRGVQYRIDEPAGTVSEEWSYGEERGERVYSSIVSNAELQTETDTVLMNFGFTFDPTLPEEDRQTLDHAEAIVVEVDRETNEEIFEIIVSNFSRDTKRSQIYRSHRVEMYD